MQGLYKDTGITATLTTTTSKSKISQTNKKIKLICYLDKDKDNHLFLDKFASASHEDDEKIVRMEGNYDDDEDE